MTWIGDITSKSTFAKLYWIRGYPGNIWNFILGNNSSKFISSSLGFVFIVFFLIILLNKFTPFSDFVFNILSFSFFEESKILSGVITCVFLFE